ncbi:MAG: (Fe-S)-binding protein [Methylococcaceae bacterium]|nr:(Fe-S)-binding protein [Methylococcaceae bacterium]
MKNTFSDIELCVKCGLCLPHCPTYGKTLDENESPRGRLALIQGWAAGKLEASPRLLEHVDNCLLCRACEAACPAQVPYGRLVDDFRSATAGQHAKPLAARIKSAAVGFSLQNPRFQRLSAPARGVLAKTGVLKSTGLADLEAGLPEVFEHGEWRGFHPASGKQTACVELFLGCTAELADAETVSAAIRLLNRLGVGVSVPAGQGCCGAMALHSGDRQGAERMQESNRAAFGAESPDAILTLASGCGAVLKEYPQAFGTRVKDICQFLSEQVWPEEIRFEPLPGRVLVHTPCSLKNLLKAGRHVPELLRRIPQLEVKTLPDTTPCCGAAGTYMLEHAQMANALREDVLESIAAIAPNYLLTSNVGCAIHLRAGLKLRGMSSVRTLHPIVLLERQTRS